MAPNKKKKKAATNPSRGFATVSQPSKSKEIPELPGESKAIESEVGHSYGSPIMQTSNKHQNSNFLAIQDMSPEQLEDHLEDAELQTIIDSHSVRCSQDARRQVSKLEQERRQLKSQSHMVSIPAALSDRYMEDLLRLCRQFSLESPARKLYEVSGDTDLLIRLWTLKKTLFMLKLPDVDRAIEHALALVTSRKIMQSNEYVWGLREVLEWYAIQYEQANLPSYDNGNIANSDLAHGVVDDLPNFGMPPSVVESQSPANAVTVPNNASDHDSDDDDVDTMLSPLPSSGSEDDDPSLFERKYIHLQTLLFRTEQKKNALAKVTPSLQSRIATLERRIDRLRRDVLFDTAAADTTWREVFRDLQIQATKAAPSRKSMKNIKNNGEDGHETSDNDSDMLVDMFFTGEEISGTKAEMDDSSTVRLVDFGKWTGMQPRRLLSEVCDTIDKTHETRFINVVKGSNSVRQKINLRWSSNHDIDEHARMSVSDELICDINARSIHIEMKSIAAVNAIQAESYLSTVTLFLLVKSGYCDQKQYNRLPTVWREFYTDLDSSRDLLVRADEKRDLKQLRKQLLHIQDHLIHVEDGVANSCHQKRTATIVSALQRKELTSFSEDEARWQWESRESSAAYRNMLQIRRGLPVYRMKHDILATIDSNPLTIICADTGAGKSTQVPSFILEHRLGHGHDCKILVTQPRRISAISLARRVSQELGEDKNALGSERSLLGYAIRMETKTSRSTRLTFATTGVLLRMIEASSELDELDYLVLDEVHERTMDLDLLFIALRQLQQRRNGLKLILMSATVDAQKFSNYFGGAPILNVPGRTFPVEVRYLEDAIEDTSDMKQYGSRVADNSDVENGSPTSEDAISTKPAHLELYSNQVKSRLAQLDEYRIDYQLTASLIEAIATKEKYQKYSRAILVFMPGMAEIRRLHGELQSRDTFTQGWVVHLLHSSFATEDLEKAFVVPSDGFRKIVIATNIAETGITIPDVTAVIDTCKEKIMRFDERRQLSRLTEGFISRSSARQRKGRAARVQEGLCFHLVTRYRYENLMLEQHVPEMLRLSLQDPILRIKVWNLGSIEETLAAAIDPPTSKNVRRAIERLKDAGALNSTEELTPLGKHIALLPLEVVLGKLAIFGIVFRCLDTVLTIVAILSSKSPFVSDKSGRQGDPRLAFARSDSDLISTLNAYQGWRKARVEGAAHQFCRRNHLSDQNLATIEDYRVQLMVYLVDAGLVHLDSGEKAALNNIRNSRKRNKSYVIPERHDTNKSDELLNVVVAMSFYPKIVLRDGKGWRNVYTNQQVHLTSNSVILSTEKPPKWLCFYEAMQATNGKLNVLETSKIPEIAIATALGAADFKFFAGAITLDNGRIKLCVRQWRELAAIKTLRECLARALEGCWATPGLSLSSLDQEWIDMFVGIVAGKDTKLA